MKKFSTEIKKWRKQFPITQADAAATIGVSVDTLRGWEQGKHEPSAAFKAFIVAKYFKNGK